MVQSILLQNKVSAAATQRMSGLPASLWSAGCTQEMESFWKDAKFKIFGKGHLQLVQKCYKTQKQTVLECLD